MFTLSEKQATVLNQNNRIITVTALDPNQTDLTLGGLIL
jgi:hypothetical protein